jgi:hypothetical protein
MTRSVERVRETPAGDNATEVARRLVVELNRRTAGDLAWLVSEEELNKTTLVNRAVQVYRKIIEVQRNGGSVIIEDPERGQQRLLIM